MNYMTKELKVNGFHIKADFSKTSIDEIFIPLLKEWTKLYEEKQERIVIFLAAPPACGKTTLSLFLEELSKSISGVLPIQALSMDGYHYHQDHILTHKVYVDGVLKEMVDVKGCPETFDLMKLKHKIKDLKQMNCRWAIYDRSAHDAIDDACEVTQQIVLIEGNYLLLDEENWCDLKDLADYTIFIRGSEPMLKKRLIQRKMMGGSLPHQAIRFYEESDRKNIKRILNHVIVADKILQLKEDNQFEQI